MRWAVLLLCAGILLGGCAHYSTTMESPDGSTVNAPIHRVWGAAVSVLSAEEIKIEAQNVSEHTLKGVAPISIWSWATDVWVKLHPQGEDKTVVYVTAGPRAQLVDWGHSKRLARDLFKKIKAVSEQ